MIPLTLSNHHLKSSQRHPEQDIPVIISTTGRKRRKNYDMRLCECGCGTLKFTFDKSGVEHSFVNGHNNKGKSKYSNPRLIPCECGCGELIPEYDKSGRKHIFVSGHNVRGKSKYSNPRLIPCECGCGELIPEYDKWGKKRRFVIGHGIKKGEENPNFGRKASPETCRKKSESTKGEKAFWFGKHHSEETKEKIRRKNTGTVKSKESKEKQREKMKGRKRSKEYCENISKAKMGDKNPMFGKKGEDHPSWKGGISFEPYCPKFNEAFKEKVRERFNRECFLCGKSEANDGRKLSVHHVQYNKNCGCDDELKCDFVPTCMSCHAKTGHNREYWENFIVDKLRRQ